MLAVFSLHSQSGLSVYQANDGQTITSGLKSHCEGELLLLVCFISYILTYLYSFSIPSNPFPFYTQQLRSLLSVQPVQLYSSPHNIHLLLPFLNTNWIDAFNSCTSFNSMIPLFANRISCNIAEGICVQMSSSVTLYHSFTQKYHESLLFPLQV